MVLSFFQPRLQRFLNAHVLLVYPLGYFLGYLWYWLHRSGKWNAPFGEMDDTVRGNPFPFSVHGGEVI